MPPYASEAWGKAKSLQDYKQHRVEGAIIIGAGPSGLATAACLQQHGVPFVIIERADCIVSLWKKNTYDRLHLHTAKHCCELPFMTLPESYPTFLTRKHFVDYLEEYARKFSIKPIFNEMVELAKYNHETGDWLVHTRQCGGGEESKDTVYKKYSCKWLVAATGENADAVLPHLPGARDFPGTIIHSSQYKNGSHFNKKKVLVVGAGNSGMEIALDLVNCGATTSIVVRSPLHVLPREMFFGMSTFSVAMTLCKIFPVRLVDCFLVAYSNLRFGKIFLYGLRRPKVGPLELKNKMGKTPILDVGTLSKIQSGDIKVRPAIECLNVSGVRFVDSTTDSYDAIILATGYKSSIPSWLHDEDEFFTEQGLSRSPLENWKGKRGLYAAGLSGKGLLQATMDARQIAKDISRAYSAQAKLNQFGSTTAIWQGFTNPACMLSAAVVIVNYIFLAHMFYCCLHMIRGAKLNIRS